MQQRGAVAGLQVEDLRAVVERGQVRDRWKISAGDRALGQVEPRLGLPLALRGRLSVSTKAIAARPMNIMIVITIMAVTMAQPSWQERTSAHEVGPVHAVAVQVLDLGRGGRPGVRVDTSSSMLWLPAAAVKVRRRSRRIACHALEVLVTTPLSSHRYRSGLPSGSGVRGVERDLSADTWP